MTGLRKRPGVSTKKLRISTSSRDSLGRSVKPSHCVYGVNALVEKSVHARERWKARHADEFDCDIGI